MFAKRLFGVGHRGPARVEVLDHHPAPVAGVQFVHGAQQFKGMGGVGHGRAQERPLQRPALALPVARRKVPQRGDEIIVVRDPPPFPAGWCGSVRRAAPPPCPRPRPNRGRRSSDHNSAGAAGQFRVQLVQPPQGRIGQDGGLDAPAPGPGPKWNSGLPGAGYIRSGNPPPPDAPRRGPAPNRSGPGPARPPRRPLPHAGARAARNIRPGPIRRTCRPLSAAAGTGHDPRRPTAAPGPRGRHRRRPGPRPSRGPPDERCRRERAGRSGPDARNPPRKGRRLPALSSPTAGRSRPTVPGRRETRCGQSRGTG